MARAEVRGGNGRAESVVGATAGMAKLQGATVCRRCAFPGRHKSFMHTLCEYHKERSVRTTFQFINAYMALRCCGKPTDVQ
jgi:hypothetical protein